jgi:hypothetical protein
MFIRSLPLPKGYRFLENDEYIKLGDLCKVAWDMTSWANVHNWVKVRFNPGSIVGSDIHTDVLYIRRLKTAGSEETATPATSKAKSDDYQEFLNAFLAKLAARQDLYLDKLPPEPTVKENCGSLNKSPKPAQLPKGYRLLEVGERMTAGDRLSTSKGLTDNLADYTTVCASVGQVYSRNSSWYILGNSIIRPITQEWLIAQLKAL